MKRTLHFAQPASFVAVTLESGERVSLPVVAGVLEHPSLAELPRLLENPKVARKYTREALRRAPWPVVRSFPRAWLLPQFASTPLPAGRRRALEILLGLR